MASGVALVTSGVGGASELVESTDSGRLFKAGNANHLASVLQDLINTPSDIFRCACAGQALVRTHFDVMCSVRRLETMFGFQRFTT